MIRVVDGDVWYEPGDGGEMPSWQAVNLNDLALKYGFQVGGIAEHLGISARQLQRDYQAALGLSPKAWLIKQRMVAAKSLVEEGIEPKEIATRLGYSRRFLFMRDFKGCYGVWPYRAFLGAATESNPERPALVAL